MGGLRAIFIFLSFWLQASAYAQSEYSVGALIETNNHLWILDTLCRHKGECILLWRVKDKGNGKPFAVPSNLCLIDNTSGKKFFPKKLTPSQGITKKYESIYLRMVFPEINDSSTCISIYSSSSFYIDSLLIPRINALQFELKYHVPLHCHHQLITRQDSVEYSDSLFIRGMSLYKTNDYQRSTICFEKCYYFDKLLDGYNWLLSPLKRGYHDYSSMWLAHCYYILGNLNFAQEYSKHLYGYKLEPYDRKDAKECDSIYNMVNSLFKPQTETEAIAEYKKMCTLDSLAFGAYHHRFALSLYELGQLYSSHRNFTKAKETFLKSFNIIKNWDKSNWLSKSLLYEMAKVEHEKGDILSAIRYMELCLDINDREFKIENDFYLLSRYNTLANYYAETGNWTRALEIIEKRLEYYKAQNNKQDYYYVLGEYAIYLANAGYYKQALRIYKDLMVYSSRLAPDEEIGDLYYNIGDYETALKYYLVAREKGILSGYSSSSIVSSLARCYAAMNQYDKAIEIQKKLVTDEANKKTVYYSNVYNGYYSYYTALSNLAYFFNLNEQYDSALVYENRSLELKKKYTAPNSDDIAYSHMNIGKSLSGKRIWDEAIKHTLFGYNVFKTQKQKRLYYRSLINLSDYSFRAHNYDGHIRYLRELLSSISDDLLSTLQELTYDERSRYIKIYSDLLNRQIPMYAYYVQSDSLASLTYDATLLIKGALLNSENRVKRLVEDSEDAVLKDLWEKRRAYRYLFKQIQENDSLAKVYNADSLQNIINEAEDSIIMRCKEYGDITQNMKMKWADVQAALNADDIAIEIVSFPIEKDSVMYVALSLRDDYKLPKMTILFEEKQLKTVFDTLYHHSEEMTELVWGALRPELQGVKNIYFSPSGTLYNIGIEYLPGMENYHIFRLSSTRELLGKKNVVSGNRAVLYGGIDYYAQPDTSFNKKNLSMLEKLVNHANVRGMKIRGGKEFLPHTMTEIKRIGEELHKARWSCVLDTMSLASEESFKSLSGKKVNALHIATHGFYYTPEEADNIGYDFLQLDNDRASAEDKSLTRSGLLMSGANHVLEGDSIPDNVEDGVLTAKEIADIDLRGLDLVVLSACQTGLGDISQGEGVFGLQRGFKKAGANSILMSLWEVNDEATQILMTQFYKNLVRGQSKHQSLQSAQKYLREYNAGQFNKPKYWAAFILLDGIVKN